MNPDLKTCLEIIKKCAKGARGETPVVGHLGFVKKERWIDVDQFLANLEKEINDLEK